MTTTVNGLEAHGVVNFESAEGGNGIAFDLGLASEVNHNWTFSLVVKNILILDTRYWMLDTGYSMLDAGCWMLGQRDLTRIGYLPSEFTPHNQVYRLIKIFV